MKLLHALVKCLSRLPVRPSSAAGALNTGLKLERLEQRLLLDGQAPSLDITGAPLYMLYDVGDTHTITYNASDPDSDATIEFFYDTDGDSANGHTSIVSGISVNDAPQQFEWDTTGVEPGLYYIHGTVTDGENTESDWFAGAVVLSSPGANPYAVFDTSMGSFVVELAQRISPVTVANFRTYATAGFYEDLIFHRVMENFMIQGGGYYSNLVPEQTNPTIINENIYNIESNLSNLTGTIAMARTTEPHTASSQFFINVVDNTSLNYVDPNNTGYCVFGMVVNGMEVVNAIRNVPVHYESAAFQHLPDDPVIINSVTIQDSLTGFDELWIPVGDSGFSSLEYADSDGTEVTVKHKTGTAIVHIVGDNLDQIYGKKDVTVTGANVEVADIELENTTDKSSLTFKTNGGADGLASIPEISGTTPLKKLSGKGINLTGTGIYLTGDGYIATLQLNDLQNGADIVMHGDDAEKGITIKAGRLGAGSDIDLASGLKSLTVVDWTGSLLTVPWASKISVKGSSKAAIAGDWGADIVVTGADTKGYGLKKFSVSGAIVDAQIDILNAMTGTIKVGDWLGGTLNVRSVKSISAKGDMSVAMDANGQGVADGKPAVDKVSVKGALTGVWDVTGDVKKVSADSIGAGWNATISENLRSLSVKHDVGDSLAPESVNLTALAALKVSIKGNLEKANLLLTQGPDEDADALGKLTVKGWVMDSVIRTNGNVTSLTAGGMKNSCLFAGVDQAWTALPDSADQFNSQATIAKVSVKGIKDALHSFIDSNIAASDLGKVKIKNVQTDNGDNAFGIAYSSLASLSYNDDLEKYKTGEGPNPNDDFEMRTL